MKLLEQQTAMFISNMIILQSKSSTRIEKFAKQIHDYQFSDHTGTPNTEIQIIFNRLKSSKSYQKITVENQSIAARPAKPARPDSEKPPLPDARFLMRPTSALAAAVSKAMAAGKIRRKFGERRTRRRRPEKCGLRSSAARLSRLRFVA